MDIETQTLFDKIEDSEWGKKSIDQRFNEYHQEHPEVYRLFIRFAYELIRNGKKKGSADAILHRIRWEHAVGGGRGFKINDHFSRCYSRLIQRDHPIFVGFFENRKAKEGYVQ